MPAPKRQRPKRSPPTPYEGPDKQLLQLRQAAIHCYIESGQHIGTAVALFNATCPEHGKATPSRFINEAWALWVRTFSVHTQHNQGRPRAVSDDAAATAVQILWDGYEADGVQRYYTSIEAACEHSQQLSAMLVQHKCTARTLLSAMQRVEPKCRSQVQVVKRPHSEENRRQRQRACEQLGGWSISRLQRTCWIDAATIWLVPKGMKVFAPPGAQMVTTDPRHPTHSSKVCKMRFYICVNALMGPVALRFITGTTDLDGNEYLTASGNPAKGCTNEEWSHVMQDIMAAAARLRLSGGWPAGQPIMYSFDNDKIHQKPETLAALKINYKNRLPLPPYSPDMHRVIERTVGRLKTAFRKWMYAHPGADTMEEYTAALTNIFFTHKKIAGADTIDRSVKRLPSLFKEILAAKGGWPSKRSL